MTATQTPQDAQPGRTRYATVLDAVDAAVGREDASDGELAAVQAFATVWAFVGLVVWTTLLLAWRLVSWPWRRRRARRDDDATWRVTARRDQRQLR